MSAPPGNALYGRWRRVAPRAELDAWEIGQREIEEAWDLRNEQLADKFDAWLGRVVRLKAPTDVGPTRFPAGEKWTVVWRLCDLLIVSWVADPTLLAVVPGAKFRARRPRALGPMDEEHARRVLETALRRAA